MEFDIVEGPTHGDQLTRDERVRLESLAQAVASNMGRSSSAEHIVDTAKRFEGYIRGNVEP